MSKYITINNNITKVPHPLEHLQINKSSEYNKIEKQTVENNINITINSNIGNTISIGDPHVWGPSQWLSYHIGASKYPINASPITKDRMKNFLYGLPIMIPCEKCKLHAITYIESNCDNLDEICSGREKLFIFFVDFHNYVNQRSNKPIMSYEKARSMYYEGSNVKIINYNASQ